MYIYRVSFNIRLSDTLKKAPRYHEQNTATKETLFQQTKPKAKHEDDKRDRAYNATTNYPHFANDTGFLRWQKAIINDSPVCIGGCPTPM